MDDTGNTEETMVLEDVEDMVINVEKTGQEVVEAVDPVVLITTSGQMVCVTTKVQISEPLQMDTKIMQPLMIKFWATIASAYDRPGWDLLVIQI